MCIRDRPFPNDYFDRVLMFDVVEHLFPWELQQAFVDIGRVLKPGGRLVIHLSLIHISEPTRPY